MDEYVFFGIVTIDETVAAFHVEPFHGSRYLLSCGSNGRQQQQNIVSTLLSTNAHTPFESTEIKAAFVYANQRLAFAQRLERFTKHAKMRLYSNCRTLASIPIAQRSTL